MVVAAREGLDKKNIKAVEIESQPESHFMFYVSLIARKSFFPSFFLWYILHWNAQGRSNSFMF